MQKMSPDELRRQMSGAQAQSQAQREYNYKASETLKNEGNKLVGCAPVPPRQSCAASTVGFPAPWPAHARRTRTQGGQARGG